ncbi:MAG: hypothetical protein GX045_02380 [Clostridiaceae bacterium]|jgi:hypothetical protein|nr:hypothetical protein [Clostridiaceae bacterium]
MEKKIYRIKKTTETMVSEKIILDCANTAEISCFSWDENGYRPKSEARVLYTEKGLHVYMISYENKITATYTKMHDPVYKESCMEFFIKPNPEKDDRYLNFEFNAIGTLNSGLGKDRFERLAIPEIYLERFKISASVKKENVKDFCGPFWSVRFFIPFDFIEEYFGKIHAGPGTEMMGNFYKCGEVVDYPHYGCWNEIKNERPDFHRPECFGRLVLE